MQVLQDFLEQFFIDIKEDVVILAFLSQHRYLLVLQAYLLEPLKPLQLVLFVELFFFHSKRLFDEPVSLPLQLTFPLLAFLLLAFSDFYGLLEVIELFLELRVFGLEGVKFAVLHGDGFDNCFVGLDFGFVLLVQSYHCRFLFDRLHYYIIELLQLFLADFATLICSIPSWFCLLHIFFLYFFYMFSDQQIRSMVRMQTNQQETQNQNMLDLSHQQLRRLKEIQLKQLNVERVNASYNYFKDFNHLNFKEINEKQEMPVKWLDLSFNFFTRIDESAESAHVLQYLKYLNISANRLESVDFSQLTVPSLEVLNLNNNQLQFFLDAPPNLKVLTLDHNHLTSLAFSGGANLSVLSAMNNKVKKIGVKLSNLLLFDLQSNLIDDLQTIKEFVTHSKELLSINLRENPVSSINNYRVMLLERCDNITEIDDIVISPHIRQGFKILKSEEKLDEMLDEANKRYVDRLSQKQKIKEELIKKMKEQEGLIQERFHSGIQEEKEQFEVLEKQAKIILGKNKLNIRSQKDEFNKKLGEYNHQQEDVQQISEEKISLIQNQHMKDYLQYLKKRPIHPTSSQSKQRRRRQSNLSSTDIREQFKHIILYDPKCVETLLKGYQVNMIEM